MSFSTSLPLQPAPVSAAAVRLAAAAGCCALAMSLGIHLWPAAHAAAPGSWGSLASSALTVLGLVLLCATAVTARRAIGRLRAQVAAQVLELQRLSAVAGAGPRSAQRAKLQALWAALPAGVLVHDAYGQIVEANPVAEHVLGASLAELRQRDAADPRWRALGIDAVGVTASDEPVQRVLRSGRSLHGETIGIHTPTGGVRWLRLNAEPLRDPQGLAIGAVSCFVDITEQRDLQTRLPQPAPEVFGTRSVDTSAWPTLSDHRTLLLRVDQALSHLQRHPGYGFAVVCLAIQTDGVAQRDPAARAHALHQTVARLLQLLRPGDAVAHGGADPELLACSSRDIAADIGASIEADIGTAMCGDAFVAVLDGVGDDATVATIVRRLHADLTEAGLTTTDGAPLACSVNLGAAPCNHADDTLTAADLLRHAELALADAKLAGTNTWRLYDPARAEGVVLEQAQHSELRSALAEGELFVVYQPMFRLADRALMGAEALLRWRHPERGLVPPQALVGLAESGGLGPAVAEVVWQQACTQFMQWQQTLGALAPPLLALNLSAAELDRPGLVDRLAAVLQEAGMPAAQLQVEFTEIPLGSDASPVRSAALASLGALGMRLALDDFGTADSSLARLHEATLDVVKIDGSFVRHSSSRANHRMLIEATVRVAAERGMKALAEGIETAEEAALMAQLGCELGQGFHFGRPLPADAFAAWVRAVAADRPGYDIAA